MDAQNNEQYIADDLKMVEIYAENLARNSTTIEDATKAVIETYIIAIDLIITGKHKAITSCLPSERVFAKEMAVNQGTLLTCMISEMYPRRTGKNIDKRIVTDFNYTKTDMILNYRFVTKDQEGAIKKCVGKENITSVCDCCFQPTLLSALKKCGACKKVQYCSVECQKNAWKVHKKNCCA